MNKQIMEAICFKEEVKAVMQGRCPFCRNFIIIGSFRNALNEKEFKISGLCQSCQNDMFGKD